MAVRTRRRGPMPKFVVPVSLAALAAGLLALGVLAARPDRPPLWEYAELTYDRRSVPVAPRPGWEEGMPKGLPVATRVTVGWRRAGALVEAAEWADLADRLGAPAGGDRLRVFDRLGADGWEV